MSDSAPASDASADLSAAMRQLGQQAREAAHSLATTPTEAKDKALVYAATALREAVPTLLEANHKDMEAATARGLSGPMLDRLALNDKRIEAMAAGVEEVGRLPDPVGEELGVWRRPNGLKIERVRVPLGVIGIIYESRPNVTADAGALCVKAGNAALLRGGSESFHSSSAIAACLAQGLSAAGLPEAAIQLVPTTDRAAVGAMLRMDEYIDVIVPRGGRSLIERVREESRIPVLSHLDGNCHTYVHASAESDMARAVVLNAKMRRTGICGATETLLVDDEIKASHLPPILDALIEAGCSIRGDDLVCAMDGRVTHAHESDWDTEYLDSILAVKLVSGVDEAVTHINKHGSRHTEAIIAEDPAVVATFFNEVDAAILMHNASTQFADGHEFGLGAEIGIATGKLHARGPVGVEQLTTYKYLVHGKGQTRPA